MGAKFEKVLEDVFDDYGALFRSRTDVDEVMDLFSNSNNDPTDVHEAKMASASAWERLLWKSIVLWRSKNHAASVARGAGDEKVRDFLEGNSGFIRYLIGYFAPSFIISRTFAVGNLMEGLGFSRL